MTLPGLTHTCYQTTTLTHTHTHTHTHTSHISHFICHASCHQVPVCKTLMKRLEPFNPLFYEEPVCSAQNPQMRALADSTHVPIATGERMFTLEEFRDLLETRY